MTASPEYLIIDAPHDDGTPGYTRLRVTCPPGLDKLDTYMTLIAEMEPGTELPVAVNIDPVDVASAH